MSCFAILLQLIRNLCNSQWSTIKCLISEWSYRLRAKNDTIFVWTNKALLKDYLLSYITISVSLLTVHMITKSYSEYKTLKKNVKFLQYMSIE